MVREDRSLILDDLIQKECIPAGDRTFSQQDEQTRKNTVGDGVLWSRQTFTPESGTENFSLDFNTHDGY
jgi:hypothetical protein